MFPKNLYDAERTYFSEKEYFRGDFNYVHAYMHANYDYEMHSHEFYEMNVIRSGVGRHYVEDAQVTAKPGDVFILPPNVRHGYFSEEKLDVYHVLIKSDFMKRYQKELSSFQGFNLLFDIEPLLRRTSGKNYNLNLGYKELDIIDREINEIISAEKAGRFANQNVRTLSLICRLCERISDDSSSNQNTVDIIPVMEYINDNLDKKLSLDLLSKMANMSKSTLNRLFIKTVGTSPMNYVTNKRIILARQLSFDKKKSKTEIAQACGFFDVSHMNKYIK